jgi:putative flippase GtrA
VKNTTLVLSYSFFALITTIVNLGSQMVSVACYKGAYAIPASIFIGTAIGLLMKYVLDKRYIFKAQTKNLAHDGYLFVLYTAMGLITTAIFWGVEYAFQWAFNDDAMRYLGGALGLAIGYFLKYQLDKRYVFQQVATP